MLLSGILTCCESEERTSATPENQEVVPPFETLLLPEDRDTTTFYPAPSISDTISFTEVIALNNQQFHAITFTHLSLVSFKEDISVEGFRFLKPDFDQRIKDLEGKRITISGFLIPVSHGQGLYALSANPYSACFFCGQAGPETVLDIRFQIPPTAYKNNSICKIAGTLDLNDDSFYDLPYIVKDAVIFE
jgi:hypothetical protein